MGNRQLVDLGEPPDELAAQDAALDALIKSDGNTDSKESSTFSETDADVALQHLIKPMQIREVVKLEFVPESGQSVPAFQLELTVGEVCICPNYISLLVLADLGFRPNGPMKFNLHYKDTVFPVHFVGAEFEFKTVAVRGLSFVRILPSKEPQYD